MQNSPTWPEGASGEEIQNVVYEVGKAHDFENLRDWFKALYEVLAGAVSRAALRQFRRAVRREGNPGA